MAIVTGPSRGVGKGCALELGGAGARRSTSPAVRSRRPTTRSRARSARPRSRSMRAGGTAVAVACDHRDDGAVATLFERVDAEQGRLDVLVNNAFLIPIELTSGRPFWDASDLELGRHVDVGTRSALRGERARRPAHGACRCGHDREHLRRRARRSTPGTSRTAWGSPRSTGFTADTATELGPHGVTVVSLWPGFVRTERIDLGAQTGQGSLPRSTSAPPSRRGSPAGEWSPSPGTPTVRTFTGRAVAVRDLAEHYGSRDVDGRLPPGPDAARARRAARRRRRSGGRESAYRGLMARSSPFSLRSMPPGGTQRNQNATPSLLEQGVDDRGHALGLAVAGFGRRWRGTSSSDSGALRRP